MNEAMHLAPSDPPLPDCRGATSRSMSIKDRPALDTYDDPLGTSTIEVNRRDIPTTHRPAERLTEGTRLRYHLAVEEGTKCNDREPVRFTRRRERVSADVIAG